MLSKEDIDSIKANIAEAKKVGMNRITLSLTIEEAEHLVKQYADLHKCEYNSLKQ